MYIFLGCGSRSPYDNLYFIGLSPTRPEEPVRRGKRRSVAPPSAVPLALPAKRQKVEKAGETPHRLSALLEQKTTPRRGRPRKPTQLTERLEFAGHLDGGNMGTVDLYLDGAAGLRVIKTVDVRKRMKADRYLLKCELEALQSLKHKNIIILLDEFIERAANGDIVFAQMLFPYYPYTLRHLISHHRSIGKPMDPHDVKNIAHDILSALIYVHDQNFIHRDVKPENIAFGVDGVGSRAVAYAVLLDFGLSCRFQEGEVLTEPLYTAG